MSEAHRVPPDAAFGSSAFRVAAIALAVFVLVASLATYLLFRQTDMALTREVLRSLEGDAAVLRQEFATGGAEAVARGIGVRTAVDPERLYLLATATAEKRAGNLDRMPAELAGRDEGGVFTYTRAGAQPGNDTTRQAVAIVSRFADGTVLLVGRDIEREKSLLARMRWIALLSMGGLALAGLFGGYAVSRRILARVEAVNNTARSIMAGDMTRRIPLAGSDDEIDALALNLNRMLDRIEQLMSGLREVSDNIAHDLKTPLNRLRNRAEAALRAPSDAQSCRSGLERTIEDADELIKTFNALLLIARLEAGALEGETEAVDIDRLVADVVELYEPVAEEAGLELSHKVAGPLVVEVNRHLVGQAVANLVDNAIKYGTGTGLGHEAGAAADRRATQRVHVAVSGSNNSVDLVVADDGPGISAADRARVLKRFVRLEESRSRPGTGLGLSLVAAVARLHGGSVRLEDNKPGLRVVLTLPRGESIPKV